MKDQLPNELYLKIEHDGRDYYMLISDNIPELGDPAKTAWLGVYRLAEIREAKDVIISKQLEKLN
jgi:hypothetical protein